jgi:hypothetical protein
MKLSEAFPSNFLKSEDLQDRDVTVVIASAELEQVGNERKLVLSFQGKQKRMICNKTNSQRIKFLYGDETDDWTGREIILTSEFVEFQGRTVKGLRVKPPVKRNGKDPGYQISSGPSATPVRQQAPADPDLDDPIPF